jgi:hypothetical protein
MTVKLKIKPRDLSALRYAWNNLSFKQLWRGEDVWEYTDVYCEVSGPDKEVQEFLNVITVGRA